MHNDGVYKLTLVGPFRLEGPDGSRIEIRSKRGQALVAMLAIAKDGEHSRPWLQERLWGSRSPEQANSSLRKELSNIRKILNKDDITILDADNGRVWLDLEHIDIDVRQVLNDNHDELLEGLDIAGEDSFEEWLRLERNALKARQPPMAMKPYNTDDFVNLEQFSQKPAIAILPFKTIEDEPALQHMAHGLSEDLIDRLSRLRWLPVIARSSSFAVQEGDTQNIARKLGAQYIVEGTLRREKDKYILLAMLNDARNGQSIWSQKIELPLESETIALEILIAEISSALGTQVDLQEQNKAQRKPQSDLNVNEIIWRGRWHLNTLTPEGFQEAEKCFDEALSKEPHSPEALIQRTWAALWQQWFTRGSESDIRTVRKMAQKAIIADYDDARGHMLAGIAESWLHQPLRSQALLERALELNPSLAFAYAQLGSTLYLNGKPNQALESIDFAIRLSPNDQHLFYFLGERAISNLLLGEYEQSIADSDASIMRRNAFWYSHVIKINALVRQQKVIDAKHALQELYTAYPKFKDHYIDWIPFVDSSWNDFLKEGLNLSRQ